MIRKYVVLIVSLLLLLLATGLYGEIDDQPRWNITLFGALFFDGTTEFGFGGAVGYSFTPQLELEGEIYTISLYDIIGISGGFLYNFYTSHNNKIPYFLGGFYQLRDGGDTINNLMFGGGIKIDLSSSLKIRFDFRLHLYDEGIWTRFFTGLMWSF